MPPASPRAFGFVFGGVFSLIALYPLLNGAAPRVWSAGIAMAFIVIALARPGLLAPLSARWQRLGMLMHAVVNPLVLGALFFLVVTPFGVLMRVFRPDVRAHLAARQPGDSYWRGREQSVARIDMRRQF
ncbi:MAG: SxtJ family membrane protein [Gammaproteobacteria bacterium]